MHLTELISGLCPESLDGHIGQLKVLKLAFVAATKPAIGTIACVMTRVSMQTWHLPDERPIGTPI